jgi:CheY-like chemotaxis protein
MTEMNLQQSRISLTAPKLSILVAEPEPDIRRVYSSFLNGWAAAIVETGEECLDLFSTPGKVFDIIVIDSHIGGLGAIETIRRMRKVVPAQHIVVTSTNPAQIRQKIRAAEIEGKLGEESIDVIQKPFSFVQLLSLVRSKAPRVSKVGLTDHVLAIYDSEEEEFAEAVAFLKRSIHYNEVALFIIRNDYEIEGLKAKMRQSGIDVDSQVSNGSLLIIHNEDWYVPDKQVDKYRIIRQWEELIQKCEQAGKKGLRAFCMMDCFFEHDFGEEVVDYEHTLPVKFEMPFVPICAYRRKDIDRLSEDQKQRLAVCHNHVWTNRK